MNGFLAYRDGLVVKDSFPSLHGCHYFEMTTIHQQVWQQLVKEKERDFQALGISNIAKVDNLDMLLTSIQDICELHERSHVFKFVKRLYPSLNHLKSFAAAINSVTQGQWAISLFWGAIQMVIEVSLHHLVQEAQRVCLACRQVQNHEGLHWI
jgi:hypothetical protein